MQVGVTGNGEWSSQNVTTQFTRVIDLSVYRGAINVPLLLLFERLDSDLVTILCIRHIGNRDTIISLLI